MPPGILPTGRSNVQILRWRARMNDLIREVVTDDDMIEVIDHLTEQAKVSDDVAWTALFLAYTLGKPTSADPQQAQFQVSGDLTLNLNQLSVEELRAAQNALKTIDATFSEVPRALNTPVPTETQ